MGTVFILTVFILIVPTFFVVIYLVRELGLSPLAAGGTFSIFLLTMMIGSYTWGFMSDCVPRKYILSICSILYAFFMLALIGFGKEISVIYVIIGAMGFSIGVPEVTFAMIPDHFPLKVVGTASGLVNALSGVASYWDL